MREAKLRKRVFHGPHSALASPRSEDRNEHKFSRGAISEGRFLADFWEKSAVSAEGVVRREKIPSLFKGTTFKRRQGGYEEGATLP